MAARKTRAPRQNITRVYNSDKPVNLFTGTVYDLIDKLKSIETKVTIEQIKHCLSFSNQNNFNEALQNISAGRPEYLSKYIGAAAINDKLETYTKNFYSLSNEGLYFDVPAYLSGAPECWLIDEQTPEPAPAKDYFINIFAPYWVNETDIFAKLVKIVSQIDGLEQSGQRLNVWAVLETNPNNNNKEPNLYFAVLIKKDSEPFNLQQLCYLIANPVLLRFAFILLKDAAGYPKNFISNIDIEKQKLNDQNYFYIPSISFDFITETPFYIGHKLLNYANFTPDFYRG